MIGHLHLFWHWCLDFAKDGDITLADPLDIADAALWEGEPQKFLDTLKENGFIDVIGEGKNPLLFVHDWNEYAGKLDDQRQKNAERQRRHRAQTQPTQEPQSDVTHTSPLHNAPEKRREEEIREEKSTESTRSPEEPINIETPIAKSLRRICKKGLTVSSLDMPKLQEALRGLEIEGATVEQMEEFGRKVKQHWTSRDRNGGARAPSFLQVLSSWHEVLALPEPNESPPIDRATPEELEALRARGRNGAQPQTFTR